MMTGGIEGTKKKKMTLALLLIAALTLRIFLAARTPGYVYDVNTFLAWALKMAESGPAGFYTEGYFADYPPGYMLVLWLVGSVLRTFSLDLSGAAARLALCAVPILADLALGAFIGYLAKPALGEKGALLAAGLVWFCPMLIFDSVIWKQVDSVLTLLLLLCFYALHKKMLPTAGLFYGLALLIKPQTLLLGPVFALCYLLPFILPKKKEDRVRAVLHTVLAFLLCMAALSAGALLFEGEQQPYVWLLEKYTTTAVSYPYASINAFNLWAMLGANWAPQETFFLFLNYQQWGAVGIAAASALLVIFAVKSWRRGNFSPWLLAGFYQVAIFTLAHNMHERYLVPGVLFLAAAFVTLRDKRLLSLAAVMSFTCVVNMATVCGNVGKDEFLQSAPMQLLVRLCSAVQVAAFLCLTALCWQICVKGRCRPVMGFGHLPFDAGRIGTQKTPAFVRADALFLALVTLAVSVASFARLGDTKAAQSSVTASGAQSCTVIFAEGFDLTELFVYPGIGTGTVTASDGQSTLSAEVGVYTSWTWTSAKSIEQPVRVYANRPITITLTDGITINELALRDAAGGLHSPISVSGEGCAALFDEQDVVPAVASYENSMYFDEVYHGRTAFEFINKLPVYETTHPPLGKDLIALGILLFGMTPFGWRFAGALFGVLMVPVLYLLAREVLKNRRWARFATLLFALDAMRFTQSRIATIDVFVVFFILLASYFMLKACRQMVCAGTRKSLLPIALSGAAFGCACACKWTGVYAGAGLAVLYFGALYARHKRLAAQSPDQAAVRFQRDLVRAIAAGVLFFAAVPALIYTVSYLPYFLREPGFGLQRLLACQWDMFDYHSRLTATHPFQSSWFSWPFIWRPVWYYMGGGLPVGKYASIAVLGNPVLWLGGLVAMVWLAVLAVRGRQGPQGGFLLISYAAQLVPWMLVSRAVFLYHYFACVPFLALAFALLLSTWETRTKKSKRRLGIFILVAAGAFFVFFYPVMSGLPVAGGWASAMRLLPSWGFYSL